MMNMFKSKLLCSSFLAAGLSAFSFGCGEDDVPTGPGDDLAGVADALPEIDATPGTDATMGSDTATASDTAAGNDVTLVLPEGPVDPACVDGLYSEELPDDSADISGILASYQPTEYRSFIDDILATRYPIGANLVTDGVTLGSRMGHCVDIFVRATPNASGMIRQISTVVHECGHFLDIAKGGFSGTYYRITPDLEFSCPRIGNDLARSRLNDDDYAPLFAEDSYRSVYLDGDPDDAKFDGGDQGFDMVFEETTQYVNSLATDWALRDQISSGSSISARDGLLTFLWYTMRYLRMARLDDPATWNKIVSNSCWRKAILTVWGRAWLYLNESEGIRQLGIRDARLMELVSDPTLLSEIQTIREREGCAAP